MKSDFELVEELRGTSCVCGRAKASGNTFCGACYRRLPQDMRRALYRRLGRGYEEAYAAAVTHFDTLERD